MKELAILGTRGIPAAHGGFETFAEHLAHYLVKRGWKVTVYCQQEGKGSVTAEIWQDITLVHIPVAVKSSAWASIMFDMRSTWHASRRHSLVLTLGYNTACFSILYRLFAVKNIFNMDGMEWKRQKWRFYEKIWLYCNERIACRLGHHLIADHPAIAQHLSTRVQQKKITMIPYGADEVQYTDVEFLKPFSLTPQTYALCIARIEPENSILEIISAFTSMPRTIRLVILGKLEPDRHAYHRKVLAAANESVVFPGAIYHQQQVQALRYHSRLYVHGHQVGGTNPSLLESLAAGTAILAHDNPFNRWVAGGAACYFSNVKECTKEMNRLLNEASDDELQRMRARSVQQFHEKFQWHDVLQKYEQLLTHVAS